MDRHFVAFPYSAIDFRDLHYFLQLWIQINTLVLRFQIECLMVSTRTGIIKLLEIRIQFINGQKYCICNNESGGVRYVLL